MRLLTATELSSEFDFRDACRAPIAAMEPHVPWGARFLTLRRDCYAARADPRLAVATRELAEFLQHEQQPLAPPSP
jgi:hypothetical protein